MIPNPPWVDKVLHKHWSAIEKAVGARFMPLPAPTVGKKDRFLEYGCGHYGCVMPCRTEGLTQSGAATRLLARREGS